MKAYPLATWAIVLLTLATHLSASEVGRFGDPSRWDFRGLEVLPRDAIIRTLSRNADTLMATHPRAPLDELPTVLCERLVRIFRLAGFPDAIVQVATDESSERMIISVDEGDRYVTNQIFVEGPVPESLRAYILARLTGGSHDTRGSNPVFDSHGDVVGWLGPDGDEVDEEDAIWTPGEPAPLDDSTRQHIYSRTTQALAEAGFRNAVVELQVETHDKTADLRIKVIDTGPQAMVTSIQVEGNKQNTSDEILKHVDLAVGDSISESKRTEMLRRLWRCGRFSKHEIRVEPAESGFAVTLDVAELENVPPLSAPFSRETTALLKAHEWLTRGAGSQRDIVVTFERLGYRGEFVCGSQGVLIQLCDPAADAETPQYAVVLSEGMIEYYELAQGRKLFIKHPELKIYFTASFTASSEDPDRPLKFLLGFGVSTDKDRPPITLRTSVAPAYATVLSTRDTAVPTWNDEILDLQLKNERIQVNAETGEILLHESQDDQGQTQFVQTVVSGRFDELRDKLEQTAAAYPDSYDPNEPLHSIAKFLRTSQLPKELTARFGLAHDAIYETLGTVIASEILRDVDRLMAARASVANDDVHLTLPTSIENPSYVAIMGLAAISLADDLFPRESWPWTVWREVGFVVAGKQKYTNAELQRVLTSESTGPLAHWLLAELLARTNNAGLAATIAQRGRLRLSTSQFRTDCEALIGKHGPLIIELTRWLGRINDQTVREVANAMGVNEELLLILGQASAISDSQQAQKALLDALDHLWIIRWRELARARMEQISGPPRF